MALLWVTIIPCYAHAPSLAVLSLQENEAGSFTLSWQTAPGFSSRDEAFISLPLNFPSHCSFSARQLNCGKDGLTGEIGFTKFDRNISALVLKITWRDGDIRNYTLTSSKNTIHITKNDHAPTSFFDTGFDYLNLGIEHILFGIDHLLFVLGLLWLAREIKLLIKTITAFTIAHSITLGGAALGWFGIPVMPVEAIIALSIVYVATEAVRKYDNRHGLTAHYPWVVAFCFGLLHGFGFANALSNIQLPEENTLSALLFFNIGIEFGQLIFVTIILFIYRAIRTLPVSIPRWIELMPLYTIGSLAMFWVFERIFAFFPPNV